MISINSVVMLMKVCRETSIKRFIRHVLAPSVQAVCDARLQEEMQSFAALPVTERVVHLDAVYDSSRNAQYCSVFALRHDTGRVLHVVGIDKSAISNSWKMEVAAVRDCLGHFVEQKLQLMEVVHDDNKEVSTVADIVSCIFSYFSFWLFISAPYMLLPPYMIQISLSNVITCVVRSDAVI